MPTYEYECTSCGQHIEVYQRFTEDALTACGSCGGALRKVFHPAGIVFKGSGFYATDNRSGAKPEGKKEPKKETKTEGGSGSSPSSPSASSSSSDGGSKGSSPKESTPS
jgi:putative FmdB family regulatory protein